MRKFMNSLGTIGRIRVGFIAVFFLGFGSAYGQGSENFENIPASNGTYLARTWTGTNSVTWTATSARTDQTLTTRAIATNSVGTVTSPSYAGGMGTLTFKYVRAFTGTSARSIAVWVNGIQIGSTITVSASSDVVANYSQVINVTGNIILEFRTAGAQIKIDDVAWTAYGGGVPVVTAASLTGTVGTAFTYNNTATNTPIIAWAISGTLPAGLSFNTSNGQITGTPTGAETQTVTVAATNATGPSTGVNNITITTSYPPAPVVTGASLTGTVGTAFTYNVIATNSPTSYALASGTLPAGLTLNTTTGVISGTPTTAGTPSVTITATNAGGPSSAATFNFTISLPPAPVVTGASLTGTVGTVFTYNVIATNSPTSYALASGTLPAGLTLNTTTGVISGTPTTAGTPSVTITATNAGGPSSAATFNFNISLPPPPVVTGGSPTGSVGTAFTYSIIASNSPTSYAIASGSLPAGLTLNTTTGVISGTPTVAGSTSVTVTATNAGGTSTAATLSFTIYSACYSTTFDVGFAKTSYVGQEITLENSILWYLDQCLIGNQTATPNDPFVGYSLRFKESATTLFEMDQDQTDGISAIQFQYRNYTGDVPTATYAVEYSTDGANSWINIGTITPSSSLQTFNYILNQAGPVRIHIKYYSGPVAAGTIRWNIDNLVMCSYSNTKEIEVTSNSTTISNGSTTTIDSNNTYYGNTFFVGDSPIVNTYTVTNVGTGILTLTTVSISGSSAFIISAGLSGTILASGASVTFSITFSATDSGTKTAVVSIGNDDANERW